MVPTLNWYGLGMIPVPEPAVGADIVQLMAILPAEEQLSEKMAKALLRV